jgi:cytoskeletal protein RodZ
VTTVANSIGILGAMRGARHLAALLIVLGTLALAMPAFALAGGSAGNNQYTNPFGSTTPSSPPATSSTSSAPPATTPATTPASTTPATTPQSSTAPTPTSVATTGEPTATAAAGAAPGTTGGSGPSLPRTGYIVGEGVGFGLVLIVSGVLIRRRVQRG